MKAIGRILLAGASAAALLLALTRGSKARLEQEQKAEVLKFFADGKTHSMTEIKLRFRTLLSEERLHACLSQLVNEWQLCRISEPVRSHTGTQVKVSFFLAPEELRSFRRLSGKPGTVTVH